MLSRDLHRHLEDNWPYELESYKALLAAAERTHTPVFGLGVPILPQGVAAAARADGAIPEVERSVASAYVRTLDERVAALIGEGGLNGRRTLWVLVGAEHAFRGMGDDDRVAQADLVRVSLFDPDIAVARVCRAPDSRHAWLATADGRMILAPLPVRCDSFRSVIQDKESASWVATRESLSVGSSAVRHSVLMRLVGDAVPMGRGVELAYLFAEPDARTRELAIEAAATDAAPSPELIMAILPAMSDTQASVREVATRALVNYVPEAPSVVQALAVKCTEATRSGERLQAASSLALTVARPDVAIPVLDRVCADVQQPWTARLEALGQVARYVRVLDRGRMPALPGASALIQRLVRMVCPL